MLKRIPKFPGYVGEKAIVLHLSSPPLRQDPRNNCIELEDVISIPDDNNSEILVFPLLHPFDTPRFDTIGECVDCFQQMFQVCSFLAIVPVSSCLS